jgi:hypothetical protein
MDLALFFIGASSSAPQARKVREGLLVVLSN